MKLSSTDHGNPMNEMQSKTVSRVPGFYELSFSDRLKVLQQIANLSEDDKKALLSHEVLTQELCDVFVENAVGTFPLPIGIATNFQVNGEDILIPMAVEETSVVAAASHGAKLVRAGGGFRTSSSRPIMTGQIQLNLKRLFSDEEIAERLNKEKDDLMAYANQTSNSLVSRGGGMIDLTWYRIPEMNGLVVNIHVDTQEAMGANIVNTMCEKLSTFFPDILGDVDIGLRILTNLTDRRTAKSECVIPKEAFKGSILPEDEIVTRIEQAYLFAYHDVYRAATNNKGVMNGIDPILIATGNDWRAVEAGAHAYAAQTGTYRPLAFWKKTLQGDLYGCLEIPMAVGVVGGVTRLHPTAKAALKIMGNPSARKLAEAIVSVGLAQNLSALRALATEGIQRGHMGLHQKNIDRQQLDLLHRAGASSR